MFFSLKDLGNVEKILFWVITRTMPPGLMGDSITTRAFLQQSIVFIRETLVFLWILGAKYVLKFGYYLIISLSSL